MDKLDPDVFQVKLHLGAATDLIKTLNRLCQKKIYIMTSIPCHVSTRGIEAHA